MFERLLVPLDGSRLAEAALPAAIQLGRALEARILLFHVIETHAPQRIHGERHLVDAEEARSYLREVAGRIAVARLGAEIEVESDGIDDVADAIVARAERAGRGLIVMCTHGHSGLRHWLAGSIAQRAAGMGRTPIVLVKPAADGSAPGFDCRRVLIPLDGDPDHEASLAAAAALGRACGSELALTEVVRTRGALRGPAASVARFLPQATAALLAGRVRHAQIYLQWLAAPLEAEGMSVTIQVERGDPAPVILEVAEIRAADLIIMSTHGRAGLAAFWSGSVAPEVINRGQRPVLLVPVGRQAANQIPT
jgi:nucleotide-binding universal stress UspA family protein